METPSRILVIEDDTITANFLDRYLTSVGYQVTKAPDGEQGLLMALRDCPDLIVLDIVMPGIDGFEVCHRVRHDLKTAYIPILIITALHGTHERIRAFEGGADDFLSKPFNVYELAARVKSLLRVKRQHDELAQRNELFSSVMRRYVAPEVAEQILLDPERYLQLGGESRLVTTLFADIRGFTRYAQTHPAPRVVELLNLVFKELTSVVFKWRGTFDKYLGDAIMAVYGAPVGYHDDALRAIRTAMDMQIAFTTLCESWTDEEERELGLGIGIHTGEAVVGNVGTESLMDYTVVGDAVNVAQRLEELSWGGQILISEETYQKVRRRAKVRWYGARVLRGREQETRIYELLDML
jgi:adenylate cyclase